MLARKVPLAPLEGVIYALYLLTDEVDRGSSLFCWLAAQAVAKAAFEKCLFWDVLQGERADSYLDCRIMLLKFHSEVDGCRIVAGYLV